MAGYSSKDFEDVVAFSWEEFLSKTRFRERLDSIQREYWEQKAKDEKLANTLEELRHNPEYLEKVKAASGNMDAIMSVLKEFSGIDMTWVELKQVWF